VVDLRRRDELSAGEPYKIRRELPIGSYGIDLGTFLEEGLKLHDAEPDPDISTLLEALKGVDEG